MHGFNYSVLEYPELNEEVMYNGVVHCVEVPNGLIVTRRNHKVLVSGNSGSTHRKIFGSNLDLGGLGVIIPDSKLTIDQVGIPEESAWKMFEPFVVRELKGRGFSTIQAMKQVLERSPEAKQELINVMKDRPILLNRAPTLWRYGIQGQMPVLVEGNAIPINPNICGVYNADFDGDSMSTHVPVSNEAVRAIKENMMPSKNLLSPKNFKAHFVPKDAANEGLYLASRIGAGEPIRFRTEEEAQEAFRKGEIKIDTPIVIG
jgi:DNA-directed RNA polymerase subunit beta'